MERPVHRCPCDARRAGTGPAAGHRRRPDRTPSRLGGRRRRAAAAGRCPGGPAARVRRARRGGGRHRAAPRDHPPRPGRVGRRPPGPPGRPGPPPRRGRPPGHKKDPAPAAGRIGPGEPEAAGGPATGERRVRAGPRGLAAAPGRRAGPTTTGRPPRAAGCGWRGHRERPAGTPGPGTPGPGGGRPSGPATRGSAPTPGGGSWSGGSRARAAGGAGRRPTWTPTTPRPAPPPGPPRTGCSARDSAAGARAPARRGTPPRRRPTPSGPAAGAARGRWRREGERPHPGATAPLIGAGGGGSSGSKSRAPGPRSRGFAGGAGPAAAVRHCPPGAPEWNPAGHRPSGRIAAAWAGAAPATAAVPVGPIRRATTATGLRATARVTPGAYPAGREVPAAESEAVRPTRPGTCPRWNCTTHPGTGGKNTE